MYLYNFGILLFSFLINFFSIFNEKAKKWKMGRIGIFESLKKDFQSEDANIAWFHCASLGEFEQGRPIMERFKAENPQFKLLLTFFSPSGYEVQWKNKEVDFVYYLPLDTASNAKQFIEITKPKMAFFVKYEFWYHYLNELNKLKIPVYSVSAIFRPNQIFFKFYGGFYRDMLKLVSHFFVQNQESKSLLNTIGIDSEITGDTRFDRVKSIALAKKELIYIKRFKKQSKLLVVGSSWNEDIEVLWSTINDLYLNKSIYGSIKVVIAPHEISIANLQFIQNKILRPTALYSELENKDVSLFDVILIDNVGMLSSIYAYADFAFVGGAYGKGLHNILEAATFGMPIFFGPKYKKFKEAVDLVDQGGAFVVKNAKDFEMVFAKVASDEQYLDRCKLVTKKYVEENIGATEKILTSLQIPK